MLDEKGRLFGKINLIDLLILLILVAAIVFLGVKFLNRDDNTVQLQTIRLTFYDDQASTHAIESLQAGTPGYDVNEAIDLGTVVSWSSWDYYDHTADSEGNAVAYVNPDYQSCYVTFEMQAELTEHGIQKDGVNYAIGHSTIFYAGDCKFYGIVYDYEVVEG